LKREISRGGIAACPESCKRAGTRREMGLGGVDERTGRSESASNYITTMVRENKTQRPTGWGGGFGLGVLPEKLKMDDTKG